VVLLHPQSCFRRHGVQTISGAQLYYPVGIGGSFSRVKLPDRESNQSAPPRAEVRNAMFLIKHRINLPLWDFFTTLNMTEM
jgi:hypothetical protein